MLLGGELDTPGPATYQGTLRSVSDGIMTLSLTADDGYRIPVPDGLLVVDVRSGSGVALSDLLDEDLSVFVDAEGVAATVQHLPHEPISGPSPFGTAPARMWSGRRDLNSRPPAPKAGALPACATSRGPHPIGASGRAEVAGRLTAAETRT